ncbi:MAG: sigma-70 family RNA polymerase sigma factor, partial [bacterium]|nr:sigma-70 family RNA polymerase sigma factor [bacterium]
NKAVDKIRQERWYAFFDVLESDFPSPHSPQKELRHKQLEEIFAGALKQLPRWDREIMVLYYVERLLIKEIADITSMSVEAVSTRLRRSREKMKELLPDTFYTDWIETHEIQKKINI